MSRDILLRVALAAVVGLIANTVTAQSSLPSNRSALEGTSSQLVKFQGGDGTILTPDDRSKYTIEFGTSASSWRVSTATEGEGAGSPPARIRSRLVRWR